MAGVEFHSDTLAQIELQTVADHFGAVPHPQRFRDYPDGLVSLAMLINGNTDKRIGVLEIIGVDVGYLDDDDEIVSMAEEQNIEGCHYFVHIKGDEEEGECVICGEPVYGGGLIHEDLCDDCSEV